MLFSLNLFSKQQSLSPFLIILPVIYCLFPFLLLPLQSISPLSYLKEHRKRLCAKYSRAFVKSSQTSLGPQIQDEHAFVSEAAAGQLHGVEQIVIGSENTTAFELKQDQLYTCSVTFGVHTIVSQYEISSRTVQ